MPLGLWLHSPGRAGSGRAVRIAVNRAVDYAHLGRVSIRFSGSGFRVSGLGLRVWRLKDPVGLNPNGPRRGCVNLHLGGFRVENSGPSDFNSPLLLLQARVSKPCDIPSC